MRRRTFLYFAALGATGAAVGGFIAARSSGGGGITTDEIGDQVQTLPRGQLPDFARPGAPGAGRLYRESAAEYRFAVEHGNDLQYIPCFCGCARFGHRSNRDCYIKSFNKDGTITFTSHAAT
jgi:hypothetical protein